MSRLHLLTLLFLVSGAAGLAYEVAWSRRLELTFGSTTYSIGTVLAAYMAGLGLGAWGFGRLADRPGSPARRYAALEAGIGLFGLVAPEVLDAIEAIYVAVGGRGGAPLRAALGLVALLVPTALMGGTLPVLVRSLVAARGDAQRATGLLYGVNTLGAVAGALLAGLWLVPALGVDGLSRATALVNLSLAGLALWLGPRLAPDVLAPDAAAVPSRPAGDAPEQAAPDEGDALRRRVAYAATFGCGALALSLEVAWTRALGLALGSTGHGFTIVLAGTLLGIGAGSLLVARRARDRDGPLAGLALALLLLGGACYGFLLCYERLLAFVFDVAQAQDRSYGAALATYLAACAALLLPATLALGVAFPLAVELGSPRAERSGGALGRLYLANTLGAIAGSLLGAFVLVPALGAEGVIRAGVGLAGVGGLALVALARRLGVWAPPRSTTLLLLGGVLALAAVAAPRWDRTMLDSGPTRPRARRARSPGEVLDELHRGGTVLELGRDGLNCYVSVRADGDDVALLLGGKPDASTIGDMPTQLMCGLAPFLSRPDARRALVVGLGSGAAARVVADFPLVERVDVVELEEAIVEAARRFFGSVNDGVLERENVRLILDDARTVILTAPAGEYDVILAEPTNPSIAGVANLFTLEHYAHAKRALRPGGAYLQWVQLYQSDAWMAKAMLRTFLEAFPHVEVWCGSATDLVLVGSEAPLVHDLARARAALEGNRGLARDLWPRLHARDALEVYGRFVVSGEELRGLVQDGEVLHDRLPRLEGHAARAAYTGADPPAVLRRMWEVGLARSTAWPALTGPPPPGVDLRLAAARHLASELESQGLARLALAGRDSAEAMALEAWMAPDPQSARRAAEAAVARWPRDPACALELAWTVVSEPARLRPLLAGLEAAGERSARYRLLRTYTLDPADPAQAVQTVAEVKAGLLALLPRHDDWPVRRRLLQRLVPCARATPRARELLEEVLRATPSDGDARLALAQATLYAGDVLRCLDLLDELAERHCMRYGRAQLVLRADALFAARHPDLGDELEELFRLYPDLREDPQLAAMAAMAGR